MKIIECVWIYQLTPTRDLYIIQYNDEVYGAVMVQQDLITDKILVELSHQSLEVKLATGRLNSSITLQAQ